MASGKNKTAGLQHTSSCHDIQLPVHNTLMTIISIFTL